MPALPVPPEAAPCDIPQAPQQELSRADAASVVVDVTAPDPIPIPGFTITAGPDAGVSEPSWEYDLTNVHTVVGPPRTLPSIALGVEVAPLRTGAEYLFIVYPVGHDAASGAPMYGVLNGYYGQFPIVDQTVSMKCPNYADPSNPITAKGSGMNVDTFVQLLNAAEPRHSNPQRS